MAVVVEILVGETLRETYRSLGKLTEVSLTVFVEVKSLAACGAP